MKNINFSNFEKKIVIIRDSIWVIFLYFIVIRSIGVYFGVGNYNLDIKLNLQEKIIGTLLWLIFILLTYYNSKLTKKLRSEYGRLFYFYYLKESLFFSFLIIVLIEFYAFIR